jgi:DNA-binding winged helix-turn-helix (wHTH) protein
VTGSGWHFGPFLADRLRYRVVRGDEVIELTPKLLDLLFHLVDRAGVLVTKEELLETLWPEANVTDNALTQAVSELRQALGDDAGDPQYIKTVARRGYRFIAPVASTDSAPSAAADAIAVVDFTNVTGDADSHWLSAGIAETVSGDLRTLGRFRVVDRGRSLKQHTTRTGLSSRSPGTWTRARGSRRLSTAWRSHPHHRPHRGCRKWRSPRDAKVDGPLAEIFELQDQVVAQFSKELGLNTAVISRKAMSSDTPSLEAYRASRRVAAARNARHRQIPGAIASFERAIRRIQYAQVTGLASAQLAAYEETRSRTSR